jgi:hypothetical protein
MTFQRKVLHLPRRRCRQYVRPKRRCIFIRLHGDTYEKTVTLTEHIVLFIKLRDTVSHAKVYVTTHSELFGLDAL